MFLFFRKKNYNHRRCTHLPNGNMHAVHFGTDIITNVEPKLWILVSDEIKNALPLPVFKSRIKTWTTDNCPCRLYIKLLLNILLKILLESMQISNRIHNS